MAGPGGNPDSIKNTLYLLAGIFCSLVLLDKGIQNKNPEILNKTGKGFKNLAPHQGIQEKPKTTNIIEIPVIDDFNLVQDDPADNSPDETYTGGENINVYFLKFYGRGSKAQSRLVRVQRKRENSVEKNIYTILNDLITGPHSEEKEKGVLTAFPKGIRYEKPIHISKGIITINFNDKLGSEAGPEIIRDRLDQLVYSLTEIPGIKGVKILINNQSLESLGGDGISLPSVLKKSSRRIMDL